MDHFILQGDNDYLKIAIQKVHGYPQELALYGGYDTTSSIEIKAGEFSVKSTIFLRTIDIYSFYEALAKCNESLTGVIGFSKYLR